MLILNPVTEWYDYVSPIGGGGIPPTVIPPLIPPYDPAWPYSTGDYVISGDKVWQSLQPSTGVVPGTDPLYWVQILPGPADVPPYLPVYEPAYPYDTGRYVVSSNRIWLSLAPSTGVFPGTDPAIWAQIMELPMLGIYDPGYSYSAGQWVSTPTGIYRSIVDSNLGNQPEISPMAWELMVGDALVEKFADVIVTVEGVLTYPITVSGVLTSPTKPLQTKVNLSGIELFYGTDFTISGNQITLIPEGFNTIPDSGWLLRIIFI